MMPKKKEHIKGVVEIYDTDIVKEAKVQGHNQACDDWTKWILERLEKIRNTPEPRCQYCFNIIDNLIKEIRGRDEDV